MGMLASSLREAPKGGVMRKRLALLSAAAAALMLILSSSAQPQSSVSIGIQDFAYNPATITVPVGTTILWTNKDVAPHTVTGRNGAFNSGTLEQNQTFAFTFNSAGTFDYFCAIHPFMTATVIVTATAEETVQEFALIHSLTDLKIYPATLTVKKGTKVRLFHTATDGSHPTVVISSNENGTEPVFGLPPFEVEVGKLTTVEFTPDREGEFFITHKTHAHDIVGKLIVQP
jgi:plastocyanin